ncbi:MAG TPA: transporter substrate-binding domain-containing protein, partial [Geobacteraceae bacterium]
MPSPPAHQPAAGTCRLRCIRASLLVLALLFFSFHASSATTTPLQAHPKKVIVVGGDRDYPPYEFIDRNGQPAGYNVELTRAIADVMGMKVEFRLGGWAEMRNALQTGTIDVLQGMSYSDERAREVDFSLPYAIINHAVFARRDSPPVNSLAELAGKSVALHRAGIMHDLLVRSQLSARLFLTDTPADAMRAVSAGKADYAIVAIVPGMYLIRELKLSNLYPAVRNVATQRYGFAVKKGNEELLSRLNEGLAILRKTGQYDPLYNKW